MKTVWWIGSCFGLAAFGLYFVGTSGALEMHPWLPWWLGIIGFCITAYVAIHNRYKTKNTLQTINDEPIVKRGFARLKVDQGELPGNIFLSRNYLLFRGTTGQPELAVPRSAAESVDAVRVGPGRVHLVVQAKDGRTLTFLLRDARGWAAEYAVAAH